MVVHELKIEKNYLAHLIDGEKKSEIRLNDRDYQNGDMLKFYNTTRRCSVGDPESYVYFKITHIHSGLGMDKGGCGYVCLSVLRADPPQ